MKFSKFFVALISFSFIVITGCSETKYVNRNASYNERRDTFSDLDVYGHWITIEPFGEVWRPDAAFDWRPYDEGYWAFTDRGWMWFSDEPYGWIVYHYGYWAFNDAAGWVWIPGYNWAPSRVRWISQNDYIGWAPLPPAGWNLPNIYDDDGGRFWMIVHARDFDDREINKYRVSVNSIENPRDWNSGREPEGNYIRRESGRDIEIINTRTENVGRGRHDLTRIRVSGNSQNTTTSQPPANINDFNLPPNGSSTRVRGNGNTNTRTDGGGRVANPNTNTNPQNIQAPNTKTDLVEPKHIEKIPVDEPVKQVPQAVRKRVVDEKKKPLKADLKKEKSDKKKKEEKETNPKEKLQQEESKTK